MRFYGVALTVLLGLPTVTEAQTYPSDPSHVTSRAQEEALDNTSLGATDASARVLMPLALDLIKDFEQWVPTAYNDASNYCTIGYGHLVAKKACANLAIELKRFTRPMDEAIGVQLLDMDSKVARLAVQGLVKEDLSDEQFKALASFVFNVGSQNFADSKMLKYINNGEYDSAAKQFSRWIRSNGLILNGLINRRPWEASLFRGDLRYGPDNKFHRNNCGALGAAPDTEAIIDIAIGEKN